MNRKKLIEILQRVKPGIASKDIVESMTHLFFTGKEVITYNDRVAIFHPLVTNFKAFVKANDIFAVLNKLKTETVDITLKNTNILISSKRTKVKLVTIEDSSFEKRVKVIRKKIKKAKWTKLPNNFLDCIEMCSFSASNRQNTTLSCISINKDGCFTSDNSKISYAEFSKPLKIKEELLFKADEIGNLVRHNPTKFFVDKNWIHFKNENDCTFSILRVIGSYPDYKEIIDFEGPTIKLPSDMAEGVDLSYIFVNDKNPTINMTIKKNRCLIDVTSSDKGSMSFEKKVKYKGETIEFSIHPEFLSDMIKRASEITIGDNKAKINTENFTFCAILFG